MKSIRLSLMVYFLALLAVALLASSLLVYRNAEQTLASKQEAMQQLIEAQYQDHCRVAEERLNSSLLSQAQLLAKLVQVQLEGYRTDTDLFQSLLFFGLATSSFNPSGYALAPLWMAESVQIPRYSQPNPSWPIHFDVRHGITAHFFRIELHEMLLPRDRESQAGEFFQIDCPPSKPYRSPTLVTAGHTFKLNVDDFDKEQVVHWVFDDTKLGNTPVHRVVLQAAGVQLERRLGSTPPGQAQGKRPSSPPQTARRQGFRGPTIYVHCAATPDKHEALLASFRQERDDEFAKVADETRDSLHNLRHWLWGISLAVFVATAAGTFWLVRLGLSPLRRLSHAVSKVSVKDFRLPLDDERPLPLELRPIVGRFTATLDLLKRAFVREKQAVADISHELRTPLAALMTTTELALRKPRSPEHYRELLGDVHASAQQMNQIVERLLTLARLDAGVDRLRVQAVDVAALARQCADVVRPLAEARGLKLTVKNRTAAANGDGPRLVQTDPDKLREIVSNLLHNAIYYNRPGGAIDLSVGRANGTLEVEVQDTGIGIADGVKERIFERFYRADPSRGGDDLHAGLGLAIVKEYIDLMGGSIGVESTEGQGSTFRVLLPVR
jgi:heavy metal sensor kinase